jgi:hypothetical protein
MISSQLQGGWVPSWHTTVVPFCGTTTVVFFAGGGGLLLLTQPAMKQAATNALANIFIDDSLCARSKVISRLQLWNLG